MPRRNHPKHRRPSGGLPQSWKPKGRKRPRGWHRGANLDAGYALAEQQLNNAERGRAA